MLDEPEVDDPSRRRCLAGLAAVGVGAGALGTGVATALSGRLPPGDGPAPGNVPGPRRDVAVPEAAAGEAAPVALEQFPASPRPYYLGRVVDPDTGHLVTRIADDPGRRVTDADILWGAPARHAYSKVAAWDASGSLLALRNAGAVKTDGTGAREWLLLDGDTFAPRATIDRPFTEMRWWSTRPGRMLLVTPDGLVDHEPLTGEERVLPGSASLVEGFEALSFGLEGNLAADDSVVAVLGTRRTDGVRCAIVYSLTRDRVDSVHEVDHPHVDYATVSASGRHLVVNAAFVEGEYDRTRVFDLATGRLIGQWDDYGTPSHFDLALDDEGRDVAVGVAKIAVRGLAPGSVISRRLDTGEIRTLIEGGYAAHTSCRALNAPGWCHVSYMGTFPDTFPGFGDELVAVRLDGSGEHRRMGRFRQADTDYWAQPQACPDPSGERAVFATNWDDPAGTAQAYVTAPPEAYG